MRRHSRVDPAELREMGATLEPQALKAQWLELSAHAEQEIDRAGAAARRAQELQPFSGGAASSERFPAARLVHVQTRQSWRRVRRW